MGLLSIVISFFRSFVVQQTFRTIHEKRSDGSDSAMAEPPGEEAGDDTEEGKKDGDNGEKSASGTKGDGFTTSGGTVQ